jgi:hypothetical protein
MRPSTRRCSRDAPAEPPHHSQAAVDLPIRSLHESRAPAGVHTRHNGSAASWMTVSVARSALRTEPRDLAIRSIDDLFCRRPRTSAPPRRAGRRTPLTFNFTQGHWDRIMPLVRTVLLETIKPCLLGLRALPKICLDSVRRKNRFARSVMMSPTAVTKFQGQKCFSPFRAAPAVLTFAVIRHILMNRPFGTTGTIAQYNRS